TTAGDGVLKRWTRYDQLGRMKQTETSDPDFPGSVKVDTRYDLSGRVWVVTNPYRATNDPTMGWTRTQYDALGRVSEVKSYSGTVPADPNNPPNANTGAVVTTYDRNATTVTDQAGKLRRSLGDGLGRLARVDEPNEAGNLGTLESPVQ